MDINMKDMTVSQLADETASLSPAPGGGSVSAMAGAYAASLVCMVAKLTLGKKGYEDQADTMTRLDEEAEALRRVLLDDIQKDSESFNEYMLALKLPKDTDDQKAVRIQAMQDALKGACMVPYQVAGKAMRALEMAVTAVEKGNINTVSDGMVGVLMGRASVLGALNNVRINLGSIKDTAFTHEMEQKCKALEEKANRLEAAANQALSAR